MKRLVLVLFLIVFAFSCSEPDRYTVTEIEATAGSDEILVNGEVQKNGENFTVNIVEKESRFNLVFRAENSTFDWVSLESQEDEDSDITIEWLEQNIAVTARGTIPERYFITIIKDNE